MSGQSSVRAWFDARTFHADALPEGTELAALKHGASIAVVVPARNEARTIGPICRSIGDSLVGRLVDEVILIDCDSSDRTAEIAGIAGARVHRLERILPEIPPVIGKGDAMWRSLAVTDADIVCFLDGDVRDFDPRFVERLVAPLLQHPALAFTKGFYERPLRVDATLVPGAGGRVTELTARPLLNAFYPELAGFLQPLAGEMAARTSLLRELPFVTGYGVDVGLLIDIAATAGLDAMAQVDLEQRIHRNRSLRELRTTAAMVSRTILDRAERDGRIAMRAASEQLLLPDAADGLEQVSVAQKERPAMRELLEDADEIANA